MIIKDEMKKAEKNRVLAVETINKNGPKYVEREDYSNKFRSLNLVPIGMLGLISIPFVVGASPLVLALSTIGVLLVGGNYYIVRYNKLRNEFKNKYNLDDVDSLYTEEIKEYKEAIKTYSIEAKKSAYFDQMDKKGIVAANIQKDDSYDVIMDMYEDYRKKKDLDAYTKMYIDYLDTKYKDYKSNGKDIKIRKLKK